MDFLSKSVQDTVRFAENLAKKAEKGSVYCLSGELGAGKTSFAKGFALGLGITEEITSPTFTIVNEYDGEIPFFHFDAYRLEGMNAYGFDIEEYLYDDGVCLIEWAEYIKNIIPHNAIWIKIEKCADKDQDQDQNSRLISMRCKQ